MARPKEKRPLKKRVSITLTEQAIESLRELSRYNDSLSEGVQAAADLLAELPPKTRKKAAS